MKRFPPNTRVTVLVAILALAFNPVVFLIPFEHTPIFWVAYGFTLFAIFAQIGLYAWTFRRPAMRSRILGLSLAVIGWCHLALQFALFFGLVLLAPDTGAGLRVAILLCTLLLLATTALAVTADAGREYIETVEQRRRTTTSFIRALQADAAALPARATDPALRARLEKFAEAARYSDPVTAPALADIEAQIAARAAALAPLVAAADTAPALAALDDLTALLADRNRRAKLAK